MRPRARPSSPRRRTGSSSLLALMLAFCSPALAGDWYVDDDGDCAGGDGTQANPFCRIQQAVDAAADGDIVYISPGTYGESVVLDRDLTLERATPIGDMVVDGGQAGSTVTVLSGVVARIEGLEITNASESGVKNHGALTLVNTTVRGNSSSTYGGGIDSDGTLVLTDCVVEGNDTVWNGGGLRNDGEARVVRCTFRDNDARDGAGLFSEFQQSVVIEDCVFESNRAARDGGGFGVDTLGSAVVSGTTVTGNQAVGSGGGVDLGHDSLVTMSDCTVQANDAQTAGGMATDAFLTFEGGRIEDNTAHIGAGLRNTGVAELRDSIVRSNVAVRDAGGLFNFEVLTVVRTVVRDNRAGDRGGGGGVNNQGFGSLTMIDCTVRDNRAGNIGFGGGIWNSGAMDLRGCKVFGNVSPHESGGGITSWADEDATIDGCVVRNNTADEYGGGIFDGGALRIVDTLVHGNLAELSGGGVASRGATLMSRCTVAANEGLVSGGGVHTFEGGSVEVDHCILADNQAPTGPDCDVEIRSRGYNLIGDTTDCVVVGDETGNLYDLDPGFLAPEQPAFALRRDSPCVDAGDAAQSPGGADLEGLPRLLDGDLDRAMVVDLGAYEYGNVRLAVDGDATPGGTLQFATTGRAGLVTLLFVGLAPGEALLRPYGAAFLDFSAPFDFFPFAVVPDTRDIVVPPALQGPLDVVLQELGIDFFSRNGNFSNAVLLRIE